MAKTYQSLVTEAREMLQDSDSTVPRYSDDFLLNILNRGLNDLSKLRPELTYTAFDANSLEVPEVIITGPPAADEVEWTDTWPWEKWFYNRMVEYVVAVAEMTDDEYTVDGRAAILLQMFRNNSIGI
ncbi:MAG: hypothetical protein JSW51_03035 [Gemmatimonadota bacterium]|jgi:hypothetical protein|nr:MAG: hypothetical protein JSW51_03035 [Gemmatimonadota bacterium]